MYLIPIQYHKLKYTDDINPAITEVAGHFDKTSVNVKGHYSLHTEYCYMARKLNSELINKYNAICTANKKGIPQLWYSRNWALEFAEFIRTITTGKHDPSIIEVHPPFSDYSDIKSFLEVYSVFEKRIKEYFPNVILLIENRSGTRYSGGNFIVSTIDQLVDLSNKLDQTELDLKITLDIPQLFTAHSISNNKIDVMDDIFNKLKEIRSNIHGLHLWGKDISISGRRIAHAGDLNTYFENDQEMKKYFLKRYYETFKDDIKRYFVPEVNSKSEDLVSICNDLKEAGFMFLDKDEVIM
jgi:hypothetical protein